MSTRSAKANRFHGRSYKLNGRLPGRLFDPDRQCDLIARATDVSARGLGLLCDVPQTSGKVLWLILPDGYIKLEVINCGDAYNGMYRIGLRLRSTERNLESIFADNGCLELSPEE